jgi:hypothetical protein
MPPPAGRDDDRLEIGTFEGHHGLSPIDHRGCRCEIIPEVADEWNFATEPFPLSDVAAHKARQSIPVLGELALRAHADQGLTRRTAMISKGHKLTMSRVKW